MLLIFTTVRETELRQLRKQTTELEEQNAILSKHIENMKQAIDKLQVEVLQQRNNNMALQGHLDALRQTLTSNFASIPLPGQEMFIFSLAIFAESFKVLSESCYHLHHHAKHRHLIISVTRGDIYTPASKKKGGVYRFSSVHSSVLPSVNNIFCHTFLSNHLSQPLWLGVLHVTYQIYFCQLSTSYFTT